MQHGGVRAAYVLKQAVPLGYIEVQKLSLSYNFTSSRIYHIIQEAAKKREEVVRK
jgi:hypothetical protein